PEQSAIHLPVFLGSKKRVPTRQWLYYQMTIVLLQIAQTATTAAIRYIGYFCSYSLLLFMYTCNYSINEEYHKKSQQHHRQHTDLRPNGVNLGLGFQPSPP